MNKQALQRLEYNKVKEELRSYAISYLGQRHIEALVPMTQEKLIRQKLDETEEAKGLLLTGSSVPIPSLEGMEPIVALLGTGYVLSERDCSHLYQFLLSCAQLIRYMAAKTAAAPHVASYAASMYTADPLKSAIERCIRGGAVLDSASKELSRTRKRMRTVEERLQAKLNGLMNRYSGILQENLYSMRGGRYVLPIKKEHRRQVQGAVLDESGSGQTVYIEPADIANLHSELSALRAEEAREELKVLSELTELAESYASDIQLNMETVGAYDFLFAKAKYAIALGGGNVGLNGEGRMELREARHPLMKGAMVPLDFAVGNGYRSLIITGPNTGGKTLALKTVGLLTLMVQSGLLVPVKAGSVFAVFEHIAADIGDGQSLEHALSTFSAHIRHVIEILRIADRKTLVLIDEMATGTDPGEGVGLSIAILEELLRRQATVVATTHYTEIKNFASATDGVENARMEFDAETLQPLYRLKIGEAGQSYAFLIAQKLGVSAGLIRRSREIAEGGLAGGTVFASASVASVAEAHNSGLETQPALSRDASGQGAAQAPAKEELGRSELAKTQPPALASAEQLAQSRPAAERRTAREQQPASPDSDSGAAVARGLELGDSVYIAYLGRTGIVCELEDSRGNVGVLIQNQKFVINKKRLALHIENTKLYPADYDLDIVFESKENRKKRKLLGRKHVEGLRIEKKPGE
ncbi:MutS domain V [Paenibacillus sp. UNCCL117]|uniref:endonuclease MutS2 n=1 Tax=unclassified Paenibacillus TaxID=185978 RepID=UPI000882F3C0|nr:MULTISPECIES: DNA mismatch repair protein MutS [unclassified Paenibacillus]SDE14535.1 MutS domain V [Paenibacillus sp. cl123]SFW60627.1 MutS domain V [Paenibacillus sp. UNCCL117]